MYLIFLLLTTAVARKTGGGGSYGKGGGGGYGGGHGYPHSTGYSGTGTGGSHQYPHSTGISGNNNIPKHTATQHNTYNTHKTEIHHHHYSPPQQIGYGSATYPVYHAPPPVYVYEYRNSGSRFDTLLTGLALYNLGRMSSHNHHYDANREYVGSHGEICKLGIRKKNGDYEETRIDCKLITSFIWETGSGSNHVTDQSGQKSTVVSSEVKVSQTTTNTGNNSVTTVTTTNTTLVDAREVKGKSIEVTRDMTCYLIRISRDTSMMKKEVECALLQTYAQTSWRNSVGRLVPILSLFVFQMFLFEVM